MSKPARRLLWAEHRGRRKCARERHYWSLERGFGVQALFNDTIGNRNTATGYQALFGNVSGDKSTAYGSQALFNNRTGNDNVATGFRTLYRNNSGSRNTGVGYRALTFNNADDNTAIGWNALYNNHDGVQNTAIGSGALFHGSGSMNTATGYQALYNNISGPANTATGFQALFSNTTGGGNTADGVSALQSNMEGFENTAVGDYALSSNTGGIRNTAVGPSALQRCIANENTAVGVSALSDNTSGERNVALGSGAGELLTTGSDNINIGYLVSGQAGEEKTIRIGTTGFSTSQTRAFIAGIYGANEGGTISPVYINSDGQLGTQPPSSSKRFKKQIKPMEGASESILALKPVTFEYKSDKTSTPQFGLIAEQVAEVNPDLVVRDKDGEIYTVRYDAVNAMVLNEFLKAHRKIEEQEHAIAQLTSGMETLTATVKQQATEIQQMSVQFKRSKAPPQMVANP